MSPIRSLHRVQRLLNVCWSDFHGALYQNSPPCTSPLPRLPQTVSPGTPRYSSAMASASQINRRLAAQGANMKEKKTEQRSFAICTPVADCSMTLKTSMMTTFLLHSAVERLRKRAIPKYPIVLQVLPSPLSPLTLLELTRPVLRICSRFAFFSTSVPLQFFLSSLIVICCISLP